MNKKIAILTLNGYYNYGNRLQNYATQEILKELGFSVETIIVQRQRQRSKLLLEDISLYAIYKKITKKYKYYLNKDLIKDREESFRNFTLKYIKETNYILSKNNIPINLNNMYDFFICGSDQIWNPYHLHGTSFYFLTFAEQDKRISYAASFGISEVPDEFVERYRSWLMEMKHISVREKNGAKIVKELTGREVIVLLDPTFMLSKKHWIFLSEESKCKPRKKYLLTYFLGNVTRNVKKYINNLAHKSDLEIINLYDISHKDVYIVNPSEFIDLINFAELVCTNSLHGVIFSIIMETPFIVFDRLTKNQSIFSRLDTVLDTFNFSSRKYNCINNYADIFNVNFSHVAPIIEHERIKSLTYLKEALTTKLR